MESDLRNTDDEDTTNQFIHIQFVDGYHASVDALYIQQTYLSLLEGSPRPEYNQYVINKAAMAIERMWGRRRTHVIEPLTDQTDTEYEWLPRWQVSVWLQCARPVRLEFGASELTVIFFCQKIATVSLELMLQEALGAMRWSDYAKDFESD